jgi:hypothetical protein
MSLHPIGAARRRLGASILLALTLAACSSSAASSGPSSSAAPGPSSAASSAGTRSAPPTKAYDVQVSLCSATSGAPCRGEVTDEQLGAVRAQLADDPTVTHQLYLSEPDSYRLAEQVLPKSESAQLAPGELPPVFLVSLSDPAAGLAAFRQRYLAQPGVAQVAACSTSPNCSVSTLRSVHLLP